MKINVVVHKNYREDFSNCLAKESIPYMVSYDGDFIRFTFDYEYDDWSCRTEDGIKCVGEIHFWHKRPSFIYNDETFGIKFGYGNDYCYCSYRKDNFDFEKKYNEWKSGTPIPERYNVEFSMTKRENVILYATSKEEAYDLAEKPSDDNRWIQSKINGKEIIWHYDPCGESYYDYWTLEGEEEEND